MGEYCQKPKELMNGHETDCLWESLTRWQPSRGPDADFWEGLTGPQLALFLREAGYPLHKQVEALQFYRHWVIPDLGPAPESNGDFKWKSVFNQNGCTLEWAWNWNTSTGKPQVRASWEPMGPVAGTNQDPLNQSPHREFLHRLAKVVPATDVSWFDSLLSSMFTADKGAYTEAGGLDVWPSTSVGVAMEFARTGLPAAKGYLIPKLPGRQLPLPYSHWTPALRALAPDNKALVVLEDFLTTNPEGKQLCPWALGVDHHPGTSGSRLKWYLQTASTSFHCIREIMTLGGRIPGLDSGLNSLYDLIKRLAHLPPDHPEESATVTPTSEKKNFLGLPATASTAYHIDIAPGAVLPSVKIYLVAGNYRTNDLDTAQGIVEWMEAQGRGSYGENFLRGLQGMAGGKLERCQHYHRAIGFGVKENGKIDVTSYLAPYVSPAQRDAANRVVKFAT